jgi:hypothetical protein
MSCLNFRCNNIYNNKYYCRLCEYAHDTDDNKNDINQGKNVMNVNIYYAKPVI